MAAEPARRRTPDKPGRQRLARGERRRHLLQAAAEFFAEAGFEGTTRALAERLGVTQALIYRYFRSKQELIDAVLAEVFGERWKPEWDTLLADTERPLEERLADFYIAYHAQSTALSMRLFVRSGLDGQSLPGRHGARLTERIFAPVIAALRSEARLPGLSEKKMMRGERELAMTLHGAVVFLGIRRHVYQMPMPKSVDDVIRLQVETFVAGARQSIVKLHAAAADSGLAVPQLTPRRRRG
ncbi:TetR/AcrR family transcriptional regulator [Pelagibius sp. CAU 1746]|uniref:TetR/AcrR family transcriptional regulator n=1 Tax=Pelagibius sp. CAU 1746 TaxID=3140370 RepID=UPI00325A75BB